MGFLEDFGAAFQDIIVPDLRVLRADIQRVDQKTDGLDARLTQKIDGSEAELLAEIRRLDARIDSVDRELKTAIDIRERIVAVEARLRT